MIARISLILVCTVFATTLVFAASKEKQQLADLLKSQEPVVGVVFEIVGGDSMTLLRAVARSRGYMDKIKKRHPGIKFVIVSHGLEQFSMLDENQVEYSILHHQVENMVKYDGVPFQVCGGFAEINDVLHDEFVDYVEVLPSAPAQLDEYASKGYRIIEMDMDL